MSEPQAAHEPGEEKDFFASPWLWRVVWLFIAALMGLLFLYEFLWMD